ncbi:MAG: LPD7 domain-containing protein [Pseudomonadota bacterium]
MVKGAGAGLIGVGIIVGAFFPPAGGVIAAVGLGIIAADLIASGIKKVAGPISRLWRKIRGKGKDKSEEEEPLLSRGGGARQESHDHDHERDREKRQSFSRPFSNGLSVNGPPGQWANNTLTLPDSLKNKYSIHEGSDSFTGLATRTYVNEKTKKPMFVDKGNRLEIMEPTKEAAEHAVAILKDKNCKACVAEGTPEFKAMLFIAGEKAGMTVHGLNAEDMKLVAQMKTQQAPSQSVVGTQNSAATLPKGKPLGVSDIPYKDIELSAEVLFNTAQKTGKDHPFKIDKIDGDIVTLTPINDGTHLQRDLKSRGPYLVDISNPSDSPAVENLKGMIKDGSLQRGGELTIKNGMVEQGDKVTAQRSRSPSLSSGRS